MNYQFVPRSELNEFEWDSEQKKWARPPIDKAVLKELNQRSASNGFFRVLGFAALLVGSGWLTVYLGGLHILLAVPPFLFYSFVAGFLNGLEHEMRHRIVFPSQLRWFSDFIYFLAHVSFRQGTRYQTISHQIHHRCTMVEGVDPEKIHPNPVTRRWVRKTLWGLAFNVLTLGIPSFIKSIWTLTKRVFGNIEPMIARQSSKKDIRFIRFESLAIIIINLGIIGIGVWLQQWYLILLLICGPQMGLAIAAFWWMTEHIGMMANTNDQRLATRGVRVTPFVRFLYGGLDEHVEHHLFPAVPSRNLTKLRELLDLPIPERVGVIACWREIMAIAKHKEEYPDDVLVPIALK